MATYRHRASGPGPAGDIWTVTMHSTGAGPLASAHGAFVTAVTEFWGGDYGDLLTVDQQCTSIVTDELDPSTGKNTAQAITSVSLKGSRSAEPTTPQRASIVTGLRTALPTRAGRGRMYWPGPAGSALTVDGELTSIDATNVAVGWAAALATMASTSAPVIYHRSTRTTTLVTSVTVAVVLGTQRRRTNKVAPSYASSAL